MTPQYLRSGGLYTQRLLAQARIAAHGAAESGHALDVQKPARVNEAPPWPPAPELIANPPNWGVPAAAEVAPPSWVASDPFKNRLLT